jgi:DNA-binding NarL/FixJ family response regulator
MPTTVKKHLRIIIVDDHEVVRLGLKALLEHHPDFTVVDEASTAKEAVQKAIAHRPEVVVMDIRLPGGSGIDACREIAQALGSETKVIMLTSYAEDEMLFEAIAAGAAGYVLKQIGGDDLVHAIETVGRGEALLDPALTQRVFERVREAQRKEEKSAFSDLTEQEMRVLVLLAEGKTNREIAQMLYLGEGTVRNYVSSILSKLGLSNRAEAAAYAVEHRIKTFQSP